jgi:hypothetical protein
VVLTGAGFSVDAGLPATNGLMARGCQRIHPERRAAFEDILDACMVNLLGKPVWKDDEIEAVLTPLTVLKMDHSDFAASPGDCRNMLRQSVFATVPSGFYQFNADAVRRGDVTQQVPAVALLEFHGKLHAFGM